VTRVRLGIVGCGWVTRERQLPALRRVPEIELVAVADLDPRADPGDLPSGAARVAGLDELLARDVDGVAICTPPESHAALARTALAAGRHVLVEKPPALELAAAERLAAAVPPGRVAACGLNLRGHRLVRRARALIRAGAIGRPLSVRAVFAQPRAAAAGWRAAPGAGGDPALDRAIHHVDLWRFLLDREVVESSVATLPGGVAVTGRLVGGIRAGADAVEGASAQRVDVEGDEGRLRLDLYSSAGLMLRPARTHALAERVRALGGRPLGGDVIASHVEQWRAFATAVRGRGEPLADLADGSKALRAVLGGREAAEPARAAAL
jgi:predicted dehydrogenase